MSDARDMVSIPAMVTRVGLDPARLSALAELNAAAATTEALMESAEDDILHVTPELKRAEAAGDLELHRLALHALIPRREVSVPAFSIDRTRVTNQQYRQFVMATGHRVPRTWPGGHIARGEERYPVTHVSHEDATAYASWARLSLPTEVEWEAATGGGDGRRYPWGEDEPAELAELAAETRGGFPADAFAALASPYGVLGLVSNFWEWCADELAVLPGGDIDAFKKMFPHARPGWRVLRGGNHAETRFLLWGRAGNQPGEDSLAYGFRCVRR